MYPDRELWSGEQQKNLPSVRKMVVEQLGKPAVGSMGTRHFGYAGSF
jgi:hypothetical protein